MTRKLIEGGSAVRVEELHPPHRETERLVLEALGPAHSSGMFRMWSLAAVCRFSGKGVDHAGNRIPLPATTPDDSDRIIDFFVRRAKAGLGFRWAVIERETGSFLGAVGFNNLHPVTEVAYHFDPGAWGRGYGLEAVREAVSWARERGFA